MHELNPIATLSSALSAVIVGLAAAGCFALLVLLSVHKTHRQVRRMRLRRFALASDVLAACGLVGVLTFAGKAILDTDLRAATQGINQARLDLGRSMVQLSIYCSKTDVQVRMMSRASTQRVEACNMHHLHEAVYDPRIDWYAARLQFRNAADPAEDPALAERLSAVATAADHLTSETLKVHELKDFADFLRQGPVSLVLFICVSTVAAAGFKVGRRAAELWPKL